MPSLDEVRAAQSMDNERRELDGLHCAGAIDAALACIGPRMERRKRAQRLFTRLSRGHVLFIRHGVLVVEPPPEDDRIVAAVDELRPELEDLCDERDRADT